MENMQEQILIEGKFNSNFKTKTIFKLLLFITVIVLIPISIPYFKSEFSIVQSYFTFISIILWICFALLIFCVIGALSNLSSKSQPKLFVTKSRVYGNFEGGDEFDLPIEEITELQVGKAGAKWIFITFGKKKLTMEDIINADEVAEVVSKLMPKEKPQKVEIVNVVTTAPQKEEKEETPTPLSSSENFSTADELKKFKELLDQGIITQEEFDAKKKQLLEI